MTKKDKSTNNDQHVYLLVVTKCNHTKLWLSMFNMRQVGTNDGFMTLE